MFKLGQIIFIGRSIVPNYINIFISSKTPNLLNSLNPLAITIELYYNLSNLW